MRLLEVSVQAGQTEPERNPLGTLPPSDYQPTPTVPGPSGTVEAQPADYTKEYPYRFGALSMAARLYLQIGGKFQRAELVRLTNEAFAGQPDIYPPISEEPGQ